MPPRWPRLSAINQCVMLPPLVVPIASWQGNKLWVMPTAITRDMTAPRASPSRDLEVAYLAGIFDGEGTVGKYRNPGRTQYHPRARIEMADREPLALAQRLFGGGLALRRKAPPRQDMWCWVLNGWDAVEGLYAEIGPWLCPRRRAQFEAALADAPPENRRGQWGWVRRRDKDAAHCQHGHPWSDENTRWSSDSRGYSYRVCRTCRRESTRRRRDARITAGSGRSAAAAVRPG
jgi:hypothetical protein